MLPGNVNPRQMKAMMKKLGMNVEPIEGVQEIVIRTAKGNYVFEAAEVTAMTMQGVTTYQIVGQPRFEEPSPEIPAEDVILVASQAGVTQDAAKAALVATRGDIAEAILRLADKHD
jgi:nascent polypeptide-associated complex subunit alpha